MIMYMNVIGRAVSSMFIIQKTLNVSAVDDFEKHFRKWKNPYNQQFVLLHNVINQCTRLGNWNCMIAAMESIIH